MELEVVLETKQERRPLKFKYNRMVNAGYVGKNQEEVRRHIQELAEKYELNERTIRRVFERLERKISG